MNDVFSASPCHECFPSLLIGRSRCWSPNQDGDHPGRACCRRCRSVFKESSSPGESVPPDTGGPGCEGVIDPGEGLQRPGVSARRARGRGLSVEPEANRSPTTNRETGSSSAFTGTINDPGP